MPKYAWNATVTAPGRDPGYGNGTVEAATPEQAKALVERFVATTDDYLARATAEDIRLTPEQ